MTTHTNATRRDMLRLAVRFAAVAASFPCIAAAASVPVVATTGRPMVALAREWFSLNSAIDGVGRGAVLDACLSASTEPADNLTEGGLPPG
jgi:hypothetical protein